jgi:hypothetical protein
LILGPYTDADHAVYEKYQLQFVQLDPYPESPEDSIPLKDYQATFVVTHAPKPIPATQIIDAYLADPVAADTQYKGQTLLITGEIANINEVFDVTALMLRDSEAQTGLQCYLTDSADADKVKVGDIVVIEGAVRGGELGPFMVADNCRVVR